MRFTLICAPATDSSADQAPLFAIAEAWVERDKEGDARGIAAGVTVGGKIRFQRGQGDRLNFLRQQGLPPPTE